MSAPIRLGFAGTPEFAATILERLLDAGWVPCVVFTQPDRPTGRGRRLQASPVKVLAEARGIEVRQPPTLRTVSLQADALDVLVVAAYGLLLPAHILEAPRLGCINVHASLLPRWRGAAPVERAILAGDRETGVCIMKMDEGLDTGPVYRRKTISIDPSTTGGELERALASLGASLLIEVLGEIETLKPSPQAGEGVTYARKLGAAERQLDWTRSAAELSRQIRALCDRAPVTVFATSNPDASEAVGKPADTAYARIRLLKACVLDSTAAKEGVPGDAVAADLSSPGTVIRTGRQGIDVRCGIGVLRITRLQLDRGKGRPIDAADALNGYAELFRVGSQLHSNPPQA